MEILFLLLIPLGTAVLCLLFRSPETLPRIVATGASLLFLGGIGLLARVWNGGPVEALGGLLYADLLSAYFVGLICFIGFLSTLYALGYMSHERHIGAVTGRTHLRTYYLLSFLFIDTMLLSVSTGNLGILWIAIEATTLISALLVGFYRKAESVQAAWKYLMICSVGISFALFGTILVYYSSVKVLGAESAALNYTTLMGVAPLLDPKVIKLAFLFILVGYGTKAGLAPMHTWLPDAHSEAPTPMSALLSGVLLSCAVYGILRFYMIVSQVVGYDFPNALLLFFGLLSMGVAAFVILVQKNIKRLFAYSSLEHMGVIAVGVGMGSHLALYGAILHVLNHAVTKTLLFFLAGNLIHRYASQNIRDIQGVLQQSPMTGIGLVIGTLAITGSPPFSIFISEFLIVAGGFQGGQFLPSVLFLIFTVTIFVGLIRHLVKMVYVKVPEDLFHEESPLDTPPPGPHDEKNDRDKPSHGGGRPFEERWGLRMATILIAALPVILLGIVIPPPLDRIIQYIVNLLGVRGPT
jgi:hydrogenase-4 component F